ncbi:FAD-dependent oxidoreductase [Streptomyces sp. NPDC047072]|uniref:FAD-dependent oxidoreductase n=1 Tax=Streptomyces sp. NPDC047072 TaxID=3154809 RepID=UPI003402B2CE
MDAETVDLLVIGGGMAGLSAAARVAAEGGTVVLVEKAERTGGSARFAGFVWTAPTFEEMRRVNPDGDPDLAAALVDGFDDGVAWIRSLGVECRPPVPVLGFGRGHQVDTNHYLDACERLLRDRGQEVLTATWTRALLTENGRVTGADCLLPDGSARRIEATWTLLATGGFQGDPELRAAHVHPQAADIALRANPHSRGDGLALGRTAGAAFGGKDAGFYGHLMPAGVSLADPARFVDLALYYSEHALLFDTTGERFVDETLGDHLSTMALLERPEARGLLVADARVHREWISASYVAGIPGVDKFQLCHRAGARAAVADSLEDFASMPEEWGYPGAVIRDRIEEYNAAAGTNDTLTPGRRHDRLPLDEPPFYVVEAAPAITFAFGGLLIDSAGHVLSDATKSPVPGLLAAGADAGGLYRRAYAGGLAPALVFGLAAARTALTETPAAVVG